MNNYKNQSSLFNLTQAAATVSDHQPRQDLFQNNQASIGF
jgi:hypothetical protein